MKRNFKSTIFMVANGTLKNGMPDSSFVRSQANSIITAGWKVFFGVVDDRTSVRGIIKNVRRLRQEIMQTRPGLVHAQYGSVTALVSYLAKGDLPLVLSFCGSDLLGTPAPSVVWRVRERVGRSIGLWTASRANAIIVKSKNLFQSLPVNLRRKAFIIPNGVDAHFFRPMEKGEARAKLGLSQATRIVLFNPSLNDNKYVKNFPLARQTVENLAKSIPNVSLQLLANASAEEVVLMLNAADCLLVTSLHEGSPNIVKEAMSCNLPVVSVPCGDVAERLAGTRPGGIFPYAACALSEAIQEVFQTESRSNGHDQLIAQGMTASLIAERLIQIYRMVQEQSF